MTPGEQVRRDAEKLQRILGPIANGFDRVPIKVEDAERMLRSLTTILVERDQAMEGLRTLDSEGFRRAEQAERERDDMRETADAYAQNFVKADKERRQAERERDEFEQACATAGEIIADLKAKLGVQAAVASVADDALLSRRRR